MTPVHATTGTDRRPGHVLSGDGLVFRLGDEVRDLSTDLSHASGGRSGKTLAKAEGLRVTLVVLEAGGTLEPEGAAGGATLHLLEGQLTVQCDAEAVKLAPGDLVVLSHNLREQVRAEERSAFLITVAWPAGAGAWGEEATAGHH
jgi:quercetin dioxygenase-like cupin family protein